MKKLIIVVVAFLYEKANNYQEEAPFNLMSIAKLHIGRGGFGFMSVCARLLSEHIGDVP
jgi:hypothetical protein